MVFTLQVLVAFATIMLSLSIIVTTMNQIVASALGLRGATLKWGLATMLEQLYEEMRSGKQGKQEKLSERVAQHVLTDPLISDSSLPLEWKRMPAKWRLASAIRFEEFARILQKLAAPNLNLPPDPNSWNDTEAETWLARNLEATRDWFDSMMDRVAQKFRMQMRCVTFVCAALLAFGLHIDTISIVRQLSVDTELTRKLNERADALMNTQTSQDQDSRKELQQSLQTIKSEVAQLNTSGFSLAPADFWTRHFFRISVVSVPDFLTDWTHLLGLMLSTALLSLGAPFWFNQLKHLVNLRSAVAEKEESERQAASGRTVEASSSRLLPPTPPAAVTYREF